MGGAVALLLGVALTGPNAAKPDLRAGWPLDGLLPWAPSSGVVTALLWSAYAVGALAVVVGLRRPVRAGGRGWLLGLAAAALVAAPMGSGDHLNYAAYGRILLGGGDPWVESPSSWAGGDDPITSAVEEPWRTEPSVYGPVATALFGLAARVGGDDLRLVVLAWQVVVVAAWLGVRWGLRRLVGPDAHARVDVLWTLNPLVLSVGLFGAHVDTVAAALAVGALVALGRGGAVGGSRSGPVSVAGPVLAGVAVALAGACKFTYLVVGLAIAVALVLGARGASGATDAASARGWRGVALLLAGAVPTLVLVHAWAGGHVYDQVGRARSSVSLATPWRPVLEALRPELGNATTRSLITVGAAVLAIVLAVLLARATRPGEAGAASVDASTVAAGPSVDAAGAARPVGAPDIAVRAAWLTAVLSTAYSLAAPYTLPWYDLLAWAMLPAVAAGLLDGVLLARLLVIAAAYVPGRVLGVSADVEQLTLGVRRAVAPWLQLALWVATVVLALRAARPARSPRPPGDPAPR